jgi:hypothetical protein
VRIAADQAVAAEIVIAGTVVIEADEGIPIGIGLINPIGLIDLDVAIGKTASNALTNLSAPIVPIIPAVVEIGSQDANPSSKR